MDGGEDLVDCFGVVWVCGVPIYDEREIAVASEEYPAGDRAGVKILGVGIAALGIRADSLIATRTSLVVGTAETKCGEGGCASERTLALAFTLSSKSPMTAGRV